MGSKSLKALAFLCMGIIPVLLKCDGTSPTQSKIDPKTTHSGMFLIQKPYEHQRFQRGNSCELSWFSSDSSVSSVSIYLCKDTVELQTITSYTTNDGSYTFSIPSVASGADYRIKIADAGDNETYDFSRVFTIYSQYSGTIAVTSPKKDTTLTWSTYHTIRWTSTGNVGTSVELSLYKDGTYQQSIDSYETNDGSYSWRVPSSLPTSSGYQVRVTSAFDDSLYGMSHKFSIVSTYNGTITVTSPDSSSTYAAGSSYNVQWSSSGSIGSYVTIKLIKDTLTIATLYSQAYDDGFQSVTIPWGMSSGSDYRVRVSSYYDNGVFGLSDTFSVTGIDDDEYEPDNKRDSASLYSEYSSSQSRSVTTSDTDWVTFSVDSGNTYIVSGQGQAALRMLLYEGSATSYTKYEYSTSPTTATQIVYTPEQSGKCYLKIYQYSNNYGSYTLLINELDPDSLLSFTAPSTSSTWSTETTQTIRWDPDSSILGSRVELHLYKDTTYIRSIDTYEGNSGSFSWYIPSALESGNDYRIQIRNDNNSDIRGFSPMFAISGVLPDEYENDDSWGLAQSIAVDGTVQNRSLSFSDTDWVEIPMVKNRSYLIKTTGSITKYVYLYDSTLSYLDYESGSSTSTLYSATNTGTKYLRIWPYSSSYGGNYQLTVYEYDPDSAVNFVTPTTSSTWSTGTSQTITWDPDSAVLGSRVNLYLYEDTTYLLSIDTYEGNSGSYTWSIPSGLASSNDYRIQIRNYSTTSIRGFSPKFSISGVLPDSYEDDDHWDQAKSITVDGTVQSRSLSLGDTDWVEIPMVDDRTYLIRTNGSFSKRVYLYDSSLTSSLSSDYGSSTDMLYTSTKSGTHFLRIYPYSSSSSYTGTYTLSVLEYDPQSSVTFISPTSATTWSSGSSYTIQWDPDTVLLGQNIELYLLFEGEQISSISTYTSNDGSYPITIPSGVESSTRYRIRMEKYNNSSLYALSDSFTVSGITPDSYEPDDSVSLAHEIATDSTVETHTLSRYDTDWYEFQGKARSVYVIETFDSVDTELLFYPSGTSGTAETDDNSGDYYNARLAWYCGTAGTYRFRVISGGTSRYGTYRIAVNEIDSLGYQYNVTNPKKDSTYTAGSVLPITWETSLPISGSVDLYLYNSQNLPTTIITGTPDDGSYSWTIPATTAPGTYRIKVSSLSISEAHGYSETFSISGN